MPLRPPFQSAPSTSEGEAAPSKLIVPTLEAAQCTLKTLQPKKKKELKRWASFKRQADRRGILVTIPEQHYMRIINRPCVYCGVVEKIGVDRVRNEGSYTKENSAPCCGPCNMAKRGTGFREFVHRARAIEKATRAVASELKRSSTAPS